MSIMSATRARAIEKVGEGIEFDHNRQKLILTGGRGIKRIHSPKLIPNTEKFHPRFGWSDKGTGKTSV